MDPGMGSETADGLRQFLSEPVLARRLSFFMGRPEVRWSVAGRTGVKLLLIALISASRLLSSFLRLLDFFRDSGCPLLLFWDLLW